jgi:hypothetical protein
VIILLSISTISGENYSIFNHSWDENLPDDFIYLRKDKTHYSYDNGGNIGFEWISKYDLVGSMYNDFLIIEGINEKGLFCYVTIMSDEIYPTINKEDNEKVIKTNDLCKWILGSFSNVIEVRDEILNLNIYSDRGMKLSVFVGDISRNVMSIIIDFEYSILVSSFYNEIIKNNKLELMGLVNNETPDQSEYDLDLSDLHSKLQRSTTNGAIIIITRYMKVISSLHSINLFTTIKM